MREKLAIYVSVCVLVLVPLSLLAVDTGTILGTVRDASGAVIPNAQVTATNVGTKVARTFRTSDTGAYEIPQLPAGTYNVTVTKNGFNTTQLNGIVLLVDQRARVDVTLELGTVTQSVEVTGTAEMVSPDSAARGTVITNQQVVDMPLDGRNFLDLTLLVPGATPAPSSAAAAFQGSAVSVNGAKAEYNNFTLDGVDNNVATVGSQAVNPSIDAIQEFKVQTGNYSAQYGRAGGAQINVVTKSGTNEFHGTLYEFFRNNNIQARNFFDLAAPGPYEQNQFGFSLGGPVELPKVYSGKNRSFFFVNYDGTRIRQALPQSALVPTAAERGGDLSSLTGTQIMDPYTGAAFPGNRIPTSLINPIATKVLGIWPLPNGTNPSSALNFFSDPSHTDNVDQLTLRGDEYVNPKNQFFFRYTRSNINTVSPGVFPNAGADLGSDPDRNVGAGWTRIFSPTRLLEVHFGYNARDTNTTQQNQIVDFAKQFGLPMISTKPTDFGIPYFIVGAYTPFGDVAIEPRTRLDRAVEGTGNLTLILGSHTLNIGATYDWANLYNSVAQQRRGVYNFTDAIYSGNALANFLLGLPTNTLISNPALLIQNVYNEPDVYIQDDWKATRRLTLNLGLRYSNMRPWHDTSTKESSFDPATGQLVTLCENNYPCGLYRPNNFDFAPRFGFAYSPLSSDKLVIRGGYGIFYATEVANPVFDQGQNPPYGGFAFNYTANSSQPGSLTLDNPFPGALASGPPVDPTLYVTDLNYRNPYIQQYSLGLQTQFKTNWLVDASYVGSVGRHILTTYDFNQPLPGPGPVQPRRPYKNFSIINYSTGRANSTYNSLQLKLQRRFSSGFTILSAYTFARSIDDEGVAWSRPQNSYNLDAERGLSDFDVTQRFVTSFIYELPFGKGKSIGSTLSGIAAKLTSGWMLSGIGAVSSGLPASPILTYDVANVDTIESGQGYTPRPNRIRSGNLATRTIQEWWNPSAFEAPAAYTFGNAGRNILIGPGLGDLDLALIKNTTITESVRLEFRAEAFNAFNRANFGMPDNQALTPLFGVINAAGDPRIFQFALKLHF